MPKQPSALYNHSSRNATARQLNISTSSSGQASVSYTSSQVPVEHTEPQPHQDSEHEFYIPEAMDIDEDPAPEDTMEENETVEAMPGVRVHVKAKRYENSVGNIHYVFLLSLTQLQDVPLKTWAKCRDDYLDECMALEGRGAFYSSCAGCRAPMPQYRCKDCMSGPLWCKTCLVERHDQSPLHIVEVRYI